MRMKQREILVQIKSCKPKAYVVYSEDWMTQSRSKRTADAPQTLF